MSKDGALQPDSINPKAAQPPDNFNPKTTPPPPDISYKSTPPLARAISPTSDDQSWDFSNQFEPAIGGSTSSVREHTHTGF